ncbi:hypothetical protein B0O99DRAFT_614232 [Bisporella sp. PMI_857]|nr:hypothetical protein B0O99DRAFT_614232 [Bisporella sp. PMI_857]
MRTVPETVIRTPFVLQLLLGLASISSADILTDVPKSNPLGIDWDPAPSPEDGPPLSADASRDPAHLKFEIIGIVGAYVGCLLLVLIGIFFVRRKHRRLAEIFARDIEMTEPRLPPLRTHLPTSPGLKSPTRNFSRPSWPAEEKSAPTPYVFPGAATSPQSPKSPYSPKTPPSLDHPDVDTRIVERDQHMLQRDLEDIYAHVMAQEEAKAAGKSVDTLPIPEPLKAAGPVPAPAPQRVNSPQKKIEKRRPSNIDLQSSPREHTKSASRSSSILSALMSPGKKASKMHISSPLASPASTRWQNQPAHEEESEPLTPRYYTPPPPPPIPKDQEPYIHPRPTSNERPPLSPTKSTRSIAEQLSAYGPGSKSAFHKHNPSQASFASSQQPEPQSATSATSIKASYPPTGSANNSTRALPFRQFQPAITSPSYSSFAQSTKTTILERTSASNGPRTGGLNTPWSANAVPYSPYQPFSPVIPITPRLVTREERKLKEKMEKKRNGPQTPKELVKSEDELWDSGY